jgi:hypothetical protein
MSSAPVKTCTLILQDGTRWEGEAFGAEVSLRGEAVHDLSQKQREFTFGRLL